MKNVKKFLLLSTLQPHPTLEYPTGDAKSFEKYALNNLFSLSRFFPEDTVEWTKWDWNEFVEKTGNQMQDFDMIFVSGSPWNVADNPYWLGDLKRLCAEFLAEKNHPPIFGICFGHQFLADFFGGKVDSLPEKHKCVAEFLCHGQMLKTWTNHTQAIVEMPKGAKVVASYKKMPYIVQFSKKIWGFQPHIERLENDAGTEKMLMEFFQSFVNGKKIANFEISGVSLDIFQNQNTDRHLSFRYEYDDDGNYLGILYQCVELVRRFLYLKTGKNFALDWNTGNAADWFANAEKMNLSKVSLLDTQEGDIFCYSGGGFLQDGHVAIVRKKTEKGVFLVHQNGYTDPTDAEIFVPFESPSFGTFEFLGILRA